MIYLLLLAAVLGYLMVEKRLLVRRVRRIPIRVHVNGTRGKTAVTRLTAELFRLAGVRTLAKTTGDAPVLHMPEGGDIPLKRQGPARIQEQVRILRTAARAGVDAVVLECMALAPHLQDAERSMLRPTVGALTNVRPDHFEVMGPALPDVADALARTTPERGVLVCGTDVPLAVIEDVAARRGTALVLAEPLRSVADPVFAENLSVACQIVRQAGVPADRVEAALKRIVARSAGDRVRRVHVDDDRAIVLVDAFSANDTVSTARLCEWAVRSHGAELPRPWVALLNARSDRPLRTLAFADSIACEPGYDAVAVTGSGGLLARRRLKRHALAVPVVSVAGGDPARLLAAVTAAIDATSFTLFGLGNYRGAGAVLRRHFEAEGPCC